MWGSSEFSEHGLLRWEIHNAFEAGGAQCPWGCIDDRWTSVVGFRGGEGRFG